MPLLCNRRLANINADSLESEARNRLTVGDSESWVAIVPNRIAQRRLEKDLLEAAGGRAVSELHILTLADLAGVLAAQAFPELKRIGDAQGAVLMELSIRELAQRQRLDFFEGARSSDVSESAFPVPRGTFELILNTIRQLKESGVAPTDIERELRMLRASGKETIETRRAADLLVIYQAYQEQLRGRFMDTYGQVLLANERYGMADGEGFIDIDFRNAFPHVRDVFISGFYYLERPSIALIAKLGAVEGLRVSVELAEGQSNPEIFAGLIELESVLIEYGFEIQDQAPRPTNEFADYLGRMLFSSTELTTEKPERSEIELNPARDAVSEVEGIARRIKLLYESDPEIRTDLSSIVVATPSSEVYTPLIEEVFRRHEIPVEIADRYHLDRAPLVLAVLSLVEMVRTGVRKRDLLRALSSPYFTFSHAGGEHIDTRNLREVFTLYQINGDAEAMLLALASQRKEAAMRTMEAGETEEFERERVREQNIVRAIDDLKHILVLLKPLRVDMMPAEFCVELRALLSKLRILEQILASSDVTISAGTLELDTRAYRSFMLLLKELESLFHLLGISDKKQSIAYYEQRLKAALIIRRYSTRPRAGGVLVTTLAQSISQPSKYLFLAGLSEGAFPMPYRPQVFLMGSLQKGERKQRLEERLLFYQAVTNASKRLYMSYPNRSSTNTEINRSSFLARLEEVIAIGVTEAPPGIFSYRDLHPVAEQVSPEDIVALKKDRPGAPWLRAMEEQSPHGRFVLKERLKKEDSIYRGRVEVELLTHDEATALEKYKAKVWSVTQLEYYAVCGFRFFARDILGLGAEEELEEGLGPLERGTAIHEILRQLLDLRRKEGSIADILDSEVNDVYQEARQLGERYFDQVSSDHPFWRLDKERLLSEDQPGGSVFQRFIDKERKLGEYKVRPRFFEVSFGGSGRAEQSPHDKELSIEEFVELDGLKLRGKIDRIDLSILPPKESQEQLLFNIIDYKSGSGAPTWNQINRKLSLQLPLYLRVAEDLLRRHYPELTGVVAVAALYQKVSEKDSPRKLGLAVESYMNTAFEKLRGKGLLKSSEELRELINATIERAKQYVDGVASGKYPLVTTDLRKECEHCAFSTVCRVDEAEAAGVLRAPA